MPFNFSEFEEDCMAMSKVLIHELHGKIHGWQWISKFIFVSGVQLQWSPTTLALRCSKVAVREF